MIKLRICNWKLNQSIQRRCKHEMMIIGSLKSELPTRLPHFAQTIFNLQKNTLKRTSEFGLKKQGIFVKLAGENPPEKTDHEKNKPSDEKLDDGKKEEKKEDEKKDKKEDEDDESEDDDSKGSLLIPLWNLLKM